MPKKSKKQENKSKWSYENGSQRTEEKNIESGKTIEEQHLDCSKCGFGLPKNLRELQKKGVIGRPICDLDDLVKEINLQQILDNLGNSEKAIKLKEFMTDNHDNKDENGRCLSCKRRVLNKLYM